MSAQRMRMVMDVDDALTGRGAVFLDRDGTIIVDTGYVRDPAAVQLVPGAGAAIARLNADDYLVLVISNQSGIGRGIISPDAYERVHARMVQLLAAEGARLDATYVCPHAPDVDPPCACRKPGTLLFTRARAEHRVSFPRSWLVGDRWRDIAPAAELGARAILIPTRDTPVDEVVRAAEIAPIATTLGAAVDVILAPEW
jgi:histidinol-phosphate phosphatase family protein